MHLGNLWGILRENEDQVDRIGPWYRSRFDLVYGVRLVHILGSTFQDGFEAWSILELLICIGILVRL